MLISQDTLCRLLLLSASGILFNNILIFRTHGFAVTLPHLLLAMTTGATLLKKHRVDYRLALIFIIMILFEICHAIGSGFMSDSEWQKSFALFAVYGTCFIILTKFNLNRNTLIKCAPWIAKLGIIMGGVGILQFILFGIGVQASIPEGWCVRSLTPIGKLIRHGGYRPAIGFATEPSYYAIGLITLLVCLFFLYNSSLINNKRLYWGSVFILLVGVLCSFSLAGIIILVILLAGLLFFTNRIKKVVFITVIIFSILFGIGQSIGIFDSIASRLQKTIQGLDNSAQIRVVAAIRLLFAESNSFETFMFGAGLGMEDREQSIYFSIYEDTTIRSFNQNSIKIHNIITAIKFFQGWLGIILYGIMLWIILLPLAGKYNTFLPILIFFVLFHFSSGLYLNPVFWSFLALVTLLRRATISN